MNLHRQDSYSQLGDLDRQFISQISLLVVLLEQPHLFNGEWVFARTILGAMALGESPYGVAVARLNNALRYVRSSEPGPAKYELRLLINGLEFNKFVPKKKTGMTIESHNAPRMESDSFQESGVC